MLYYQQDISWRKFMKNKIALLNAIFILNLCLLLIGIIDIIQIIFTSNHIFEGDLLIIVILGYPFLSIYNLNINYIFVDKSINERKKVIFSSFLVLFYPLLTGVIYYIIS